jgi:DNA-binding CsgD family transcriptional regulator
MSAVVEEAGPLDRGDLLARARKLHAEATKLERRANTNGAVPGPDLEVTNWALLLNTPLQVLVATAAPIARVDLCTHRAGLEDARRAVVAARTDTSEVALTHAASAEGASRGDAHVLRGVAMARSLVALREGQAGKAYQLLEVVFDARGQQTGSHSAIQLAGLFAEAALRSRREHEASKTLRAWLNCRGLSDDPAQLHGEIALAMLFFQPGDPVSHLTAWIAGSTPHQPLEVARIQLAAGVWLRRHRRSVEARAYLQAAATVFEMDGGEPWLEFCRAEVSAASLIKHHEGGTVKLSRQQATIARLVAQGFSNKQIAERLCLSPRTVSSHLYRMFPALGVTSRYELMTAVRAGADPLLA